MISRYNREFQKAKRELSVQLANIEGIWMYALINIEEMLQLVFIHLTLAQ